ncbi:hypothetical protein [Paracidobacterium acidisoli]|uniref:Uncharacterized protein n=1 Tax=Paracidobacterium acidisoli TaxID=2303751 RepID=A0A372ILT9_9BACT|nr:hypothetical protein [Paracidobacterium acidisoli]MBT9332459.1 hypothetical protein [Paracidobacterium acidisoli]
MAASNPAVSIQVSVTLQASTCGEKSPQAVAYAFTSSGRFLTRAAVSGEGATVLNVPAAGAAREVRIVVGPEVEGDQSPSLSELTRRGASEQFVRITADAKVPPVIFEIPSEIQRCWIRRCLVQGTLLKSVITGGLPVDMPVCGAEVQIWEVEPIEIIIPKLPISVIEKLRQIVLTPIGPVNPNPPDPAPFTNVAALSASLQLAKPVPTIASPAPSSPEYASLQILAQTSDAESFRQALLSNISIVRSWLCELIPRFVTKTLIATTTTDRCGHFQELIFPGCLGSSPNLYFTASLSFYGFSLFLYAPTPVACYTHWGYQCGTEVTLYTDSIFAPCCSPCAPVNAGENYVLFRAIGGVDLSSIYGASPLLPSTPLGLAAGAVVVGEDSPFGATLLPRVEFDSSLLENGLASYYQISYWDTTQSQWIVLAGDIYRHYNEFVGGQLVTKSYLVGPQPSAPKPNLFAIPPALPPVGDWAYPNPANDLANAQFPTASLPTGSTPPTYGLYQLKLDLFDAAGNEVDINAAGIKYYVPSSVEPDGTINTVDASTLSLVSGNSMIISLYVDNRPTQAQLPAVSTPVDSTASDPCGILHYNGPGDNVDIEYVAWQPGNFLDWNLYVVRGTTGTVASLAGNTSAGSPGSPVDFNNTVATLIGSCPQAAFGVNLYCQFRGTDGWSRLGYGYDSSQSIAFALTVPCPQTKPQ